MPWAIWSIDVTLIVSFPFPHPATQQQNEVAILTNMATAVSLPQIFGDERDNILSKWNQLQAFWGTGKGFYDQQGNAVEFSSHNPFCRFKVSVLYQSTLVCQNNKESSSIILISLSMCYILYMCVLLLIMSCTLKVILRVIIGAGPYIEFASIKSQVKYWWSNSCPFQVQF